MKAKIAELNAEDSAIDWQAMSEDERKRAEQAVLENFDEDMNPKGLKRYLEIEHEINELNADQE